MKRKNSKLLKTRLNQAKTLIAPVIFALTREHGSSKPVGGSARLCKARSAKRSWRVYANCPTRAKKVLFCKGERIDGMEMGGRLRKRTKNDAY